MECHHGVERLGKWLKKVRCPKCGKWGAYGSKVLKCAHCVNQFERKECAFMDGVYLSKTDVQNRYEKYIEEGVNRLDLSDRVVEKTTKMIGDLSGTFTSGRNPRTLTAGAIYLSTLVEGERRSQGEVAEVFNVSVGGVQDNYRRIAKELQIGEFNLDSCSGKEEWIPPKS